MRRYSTNGKTESYGAMLTQRLSAQRKARKAGGEGATAIPAEVGELHPDRYPRHPNPAKGQVWGGECNRTACTSHGAVILNRGTYGLYCVTCAHGINGRDPVPLCIRVGEKPTIAQMNAHYTEMMEQMARLRSTAG